MEAQELIVWLLNVLVAAAIWGSKHLISWLGKKVDNEIFKKAVAKLNSAVWTAVVEVKQVYIDEIKQGQEEGSPGGKKLTKKEKEKALKMALEKAKSYLGVDGLKLLGKAFGILNGDLDKFLIGQIESTIPFAKVGALDPTKPNPQK